MKQSPSQSPGRLLAGLVFMNLIGAMISSLGAPLIPTIAEVDHVSLLNAQWSLTIAVLVSVVAMPLTGRMADGPHRRRVILFVLFSATLGGVLAAASVDFGMLLCGRALQGLGMGITPLAMAVARSELPEDRVRPSVALLSITNSVGIGLGYPVTGLVAQGLGLRGAFWFGAVVAAAALAAGWLIVPNAVRHSRAPIDIPGAVLLAVALAAVLVAFSQGPNWGWGSGRVLGFLLGGLIVGVVWAVYQLRTQHPLVNLRLLRHPAVLTADITVLVAGVGMYVLLSLATEVAQAPVADGGLGATTVVTGLALVPLSVGTLLSSRLVPIMKRLMSQRSRLPAAAVLMLAAMAVFAAWHDALWQLLVVMFIAGLGIGLFFSLTPELIVGAVALEETGSAMSFNQIFRNVGYSIGSALSAVVLSAYTAAGAQLPKPSGYTAAAVVACLVWVAAAVITLLLGSARRGEHDQPHSSSDTRTRLVKR